MATGQNSPGVVFQERDLTTTSTFPSANVGVLVAPFDQGPVDEVVEITSERDLVERFGKPNEYNYEYWYTAAQFLSLWWFAVKYSELLTLHLRTRLNGALHL